MDQPPVPPGEGLDQLLAAAAVVEPVPVIRPTLLPFDPVVEKAFSASYDASIRRGIFWIETINIIFLLTEFIK